MSIRLLNRIFLTVAVPFAHYVNELILKVYICDYIHLQTYNFFNSFSWDCTQNISFIKLFSRAISLISTQGLGNCQKYLTIFATCNVSFKYRNNSACTTKYCSNTSNFCCFCFIWTVSVSYNYHSSFKSKKKIKTYQMYIIRNVPNVTYTCIILISVWKQHNSIFNTIYSVYPIWDIEFYNQFEKKNVFISDFNCKKILWYLLRSTIILSQLYARTSGWGELMWGGGKLKEMPVPILQPVSRKKNVFIFVLNTFESQICTKHVKASYLSLPYKLQEAVYTLVILRNLFICCQFWEQIHAEVMKPYSSNHMDKQTKVLCKKTPCIHVHMYTCSTLCSIVFMFHTPHCFIEVSFLWLAIKGNKPSTHF